jgi:CxxC motif-containing protein (DUF1111 family)
MMMRRFLTLCALPLLASLLTGCQEEEGAGPAPGDNTEVYAGGATTVFLTGASAYSMPAPNLGAEGLETHLDGDRQFEQVFVTAPADVNAGLGPLFNNSSCEGCHPSDGRGRPPLAGEAISSMLIRISVDGADADGGPKPVPGFGTQLQQRAVHGTAPEGNVDIVWTEVPGSYVDGTPYSLRRPTILLSGRIPAGVRTSARVAPPVFGLGLLEAVEEAAILALAGNPEALRDNVSGRPNYVWDAAGQRTRLGKFGWKAGTATLQQQVAGAYNQDIGVTSPLFPGENCTGTAECDTLADDPEITEDILEAVTFYTQTLGVPSRRDFDDPNVVRGKALFKTAGCTSCHVERLTTGVLPGVPEVSSQTIFPYTDMLLHDMGPELADERPDFEASGTEWRTPPLWGIGLTQIVNGHTNFLHDGRARNLEEAILWHGGEAELSRDRFRSLTSDERALLLRFIMSL